MKVLLTGASGYIGSAIAQALLDRGHTVAGLVPDASRAERVPAGVHTATGDLGDASSLRKATEGVEGVVHAASSNDQRAGELDRIAVSALLEELAGSDRPFVYTSGLWLHGHTGDQEADEDASLDPPLVVSWRPAIEDMVREAAAQGVRSVRIRPALVYGDGGGFIPMLLGPQDGAVRPIDGGANRWAVVHRSDLADLYVRALTDAPAGAVYLGASGQSVRVAEAARVIAAATSSRIESWPREQAEQVWSVMVDAFLLDQAASGDRARRELGWNPAGPGLLDDLAATMGGNTEATAADDRAATM